MRSVGKLVVDNDFSISSDDLKRTKEDVVNSGLTTAFVIGGKTMGKKKYFFKHSFVRLCWEDILKVFPWANWAYISPNGSVYVSSEKPCFDGVNNSHEGAFECLAKLHHRFANWQNLIWAAPLHIDPDIWKAIELLHGPEYRWVAMEKNGAVFTYNEKPFLDKDDNFAGNGWMELERVEPYCDNWRNSLVEKPTQ